MIAQGVFAILMTDKSAGLAAAAGTSADRLAKSQEREDTSEQECVAGDVCQGQFGFMALRILQFPAKGVM